MKSKVISIIIMIGIMAWACITITNITEKAREPEIKIAEVGTNILYLPQYVAINKGYFEDANIHVKLIDVKNKDEAIASIILDDVQITIIDYNSIRNLSETKLLEYPIPFIKISKLHNNYIVYGATEYYINNNKENILKINKAIDKAFIFINGSDNRTIARSVKSFFPDTKFYKLIGMIKNYKKNNIR